MHLSERNWFGLMAQKMWIFDFPGAATELERKMMTLDVGKLYALLRAFCNARCNIRVGELQYSRQDPEPPLGLDCLAKSLYERTLLEVVARQSPQSLV